MIKDLSRKLERKKMIAEGDLSLLTKDEEDANTLERLNDEVYLRKYNKFTNNSYFFFMCSR